eukprot:3921529-Prymnesium_polylepis.2
MATRTRASMPPASPARRAAREKNWSRRSPARMFCAVVSGATASSRRASLSSSGSRADPITMVSLCRNSKARARAPRATESSTRSTTARALRPPAARADGVASRRASPGRRAGARRRAPASPRAPRPPRGWRAGRGWRRPTRRRARRESRRARRGSAPGWRRVARASRRRRDPRGR